MIKLIITATALDLLLGDPRWLPHPVVIIGKWIAKVEHLLRKWAATKRALKIGGVLLVVSTVGGTYLIVYLLISAAQKIHPYLGILLQVWFLYTAISVKSLHQHALAVAQPLRKGDLVEARKKLSYIVGRDTENLDEGEITRGVVETVAENTVDGIISPLFYGFLGGAPLALAYKAVNTLDSMVGYKEEKYLHLGWASARFDDLANFIPARIAGLFFVCAAFITPKGPRAAWQMIRRDAKKHPSPNGGIPESAVAGGLGIKLGGTNYYFGKPSYRAEIGEAIVPLGMKHITKVIQLMYIATFLMVISGGIIEGLLRGL